MIFFELTKEESAALRSKISTIEESALTLEPMSGKVPDLQTTETESSLEINFFIGKIKHTVKRVRKDISKRE